MFAASNGGLHLVVPYDLKEEKFCLYQSQGRSIIQQSTSDIGGCPMNFQYASHREGAQTLVISKTAQPNPFISRAYFICFGTNRRTKATPILHSLLLYRFRVST